MENNVSIIKERQFITKEFADTLAGKTPAPYLRLHDPVQKGLARLAADLRGRPKGETAYLDRMIHFWREVSLAGLPRAGTSQDECYALLFESTFDLAQAEPEWALECLAEKSTSKSSVPADELAHQIAGLEIGHSSIAAALTRLHAPMRESDPQKWSNELTIAFVGDVLFWNAMLCAVGIDEHHRLWPFRCALAQSSHNGWGDRHRLHARLIRESPQRASKSPRAQLMAHPILRLARLKYREGSVEQKQVLRFLNAQCIRQGFESEKDCFDSDLTLAQWVRDARQWATNMQEAELQVCEELFDEAGEKALARTRTFYHQHLGTDPALIDSLDATVALIKWAKQRRGFEFSQYRAQVWEFVVEIADVALWLGWLFPSGAGELSNLQIQNLPRIVTCTESNAGVDLEPVPRAKLLFRAWLFHGPGFAEELQFFVAPSKCGSYDVLWLSSDWGRDSDLSALAWITKDTLTGSALWEALLVGCWKGQKAASGWNRPNFDEIITDKKSRLSPEAVWEIVERIWPPTR